MPSLKQVLFFVLLSASASAYALEPTYDLQHIYDLTNSLEFSHWAEELIPGAPEKGVLLFKIVALSVTLPLFAILLVWGIVNDLQTETMMPNVSRVDYIALAKRIFIFIVFLGFGTAIYGYLTSLQRGMHSIIEIVCSQDSEFFLKAFYKESATNQNKLTRAIGAGKEDAVNSLLNTAKELVKYKDAEKGAIRTVTRSHYMAIPLAAYNEALLLYAGDRQVSLPSGSAAKTYRNAAPCVAEYPALLAGENCNALRGAALSAYASILRAYPEYPTAYSKSERDARAAMNEALNDTLARGQSERTESVQAISSAKNPKPPSDADFAEFLIESISKNSEPNMALPKFVRAQILFLAEYDPVVRQGINRILWELYNRDAGELEGLSIEETEAKLAEAKCASTPEDARKHSLPENYEALVREHVAQLIIAQATVTGATKSIIGDGGEPLSPSAFLEQLTRTPAWYQKLWDWGASKIQSACSLASGTLKSVTDIPLRIFAQIVEWFVTFTFWMEKIIVYVMVVIISYVLTLQFFFASITCCFVACRQTENIFYHNFKLCLHFALIPFMCMLLLTIFNVAVNNMWSSLVPQPNGITSGVGGISIVGAAALPAAGLASGGYALQIALVICVFQIAGMLFLAVYSIKAAGTLVRGGGVGGSLLAAAGGALLAGKLASSAFGMSMGAPAASSISAASKARGIGGPGDSGAGSAGNPPTDGGKPPKAPVPVPMPPDTSKDKMPSNTAQSAQNTSPKQAHAQAAAPGQGSRNPAAASPPPNPASGIKPSAAASPSSPTPQAPPGAEIQPETPAAKGLFGKYADLQKKVYKRTNPRMGLWAKGAVASIFPNLVNGRNKDGSNNGI